MNAPHAEPLPAGVNFIYHTIARGGGMERAVVDLILGFARRGVPVRGIAMRTDASVFPEDARRRIELVRIPARFPFSLSQRFADLDFEERAAGFCRAGWKTVSASRVPAPVDMAVSGGTHFAHLQKKGKARPSLTDRKIMAHEAAFHAAAGVSVAHSKTTRDEIRALRVKPDEKVVCVFPPVDAARFSLAARASRERLRREWGVPSGMFVLLFPSNDHQRKGLDLILAALDAADFPDVVLAVASRRAVNHPRALNIGYRADMENCYAAADASILASRYEPFGLVGVESILCGTPALLSDACGATEALAEPGCLKFSPTPESLEGTLRRARERFFAGTLALTDPAASIKYPYSLDAHIGVLLRLLARA